MKDISTIRVEPASDRAQLGLVPALTIVSHANLMRAGERTVLRALAVGEDVEVSRTSPGFGRRGQPHREPLGDPFLSRKPLIFSPGRSGGVVLRVAEGGTSVSVAGAPVLGEHELGPEALAAGVPLVLSQRVVLLLHLVEQDVDAREPEERFGMVGDSDALRRVQAQIHNTVDLDVPVLVRGETGTGKERVAQALGEHGPRRTGPFVSVNLAALSKELAAAELFGARRGAFTGALRDRDGFFKSADGGTIFLDEVGEASPEVQVLLLRALEEGKIYPVGSTVAVKVNVRLISATDADLEARMNAGQFRAPLLHRLAGYEISIPPLRERREDIGLLFAHFAQVELSAIGQAQMLASPDPRAEPWLPASLALGLLCYSWPGNIRELQNVARRLVIDNRGNPVLKADAKLARELGLALQADALSAVPASPRTSVPPSRRKPSDISWEELEAALEACEWSPHAAAERLGLPHSSAYFLIGKYPEHIRLANDLTAEQILHSHQECGGKLGKMVKQLKVSRSALKRRIKSLGLELDLDES